MINRAVSSHCPWTLLLICFFPYLFPFKMYCSVGQKPPRFNLVLKTLSFSGSGTFQEDLAVGINDNCASNQEPKFGKGDSVTRFANTGKSFCTGSKIIHSIDAQLLMAEAPLNGLWRVLPCAVMQVDWWQQRGYCGRMHDSLWCKKFATGKRKFFIAMAATHLEFQSHILDQKVSKLNSWKSLLARWNGVKHCNGCIGFCPKPSCEKEQMSFNSKL